MSKEKPKFNTDSEKNSQPSRASTIRSQLTGKKQAFRRDNVPVHMRILDAQDSILELNASRQTNEEGPRNEGKFRSPSGFMLQLV